MDPIEKRELKRKAWRRLADQRRRAGLLRGRVVALSLVCFALLWGIVFVQMATGNDPVLSGKEKATTRATASTARARRHRRAGAGPTATEREVEEVEAEPEGEVLGPEAEFEAAETEPEAEEVAPEVEEAEPEVEEVEPEFVEEPLVTSQS
jgi:hypothetical protein